MVFMDIRDFKFAILFYKSELFGREFSILSGPPVRMAGSYCARVKRMLKPTLVLAVG